MKRDPRIHFIVADEMSEMEFPIKRHDFKPSIFDGSPECWCGFDWKNAIHR